jgi:acetylornithine deacetylase/succinyl-diaminopimelate desuccinylase-like protein
MPMNALWMTLAAAPLAAALALGSTPAGAAELNAEQKLFRSIYQELVEINTSDSEGDTTTASKAMQARLLAAGFKPDEMEVIAPFPRKGNLVARYKGNGSKKPMLLLAHIDVVEAKRSEWKTDPFKLQEKDGVFTARGAIDDKAMASIYVSVLGQLKKEGFKPSRDIILALTADEEKGNSPANGASWLLKNRRHLVDAEFGLNEGGRGELKDGKPLSHIVQMAEKTYVQAEFEATGPGGHSARPTVDNTIYELAEALVRLRQHQFPVNLNDAARLYFERSAPSQSGQMAADMREVAKPDPDHAAVARLSRVSNIVGLMRSTCVATMLNAGHAPNALAQTAKASVNCRLLPDEDADAVSKKLVELAGPKVKVTFARESDPAPSSPLRPDVMGPIEATSAELWPGVPVIPTMGVSTTDSRHYRAAGIPMYGVSGLFVDPQDTGVHGLNEHIGVQQLYDGREFLYRLIKRLAQ